MRVGRQAELLWSVSDAEGDGHAGQVRRIDRQRVIELRLAGRRRAQNEGEGGEQERDSRHGLAR
jgi:hypothetical protein